MIGEGVSLGPQHFLYFFPLPQGQGSFRPGFWDMQGKDTAF
jgi:hypothetical protein